MIWQVWLRVAPLPGCKVVQEAFDPRLECVIDAESRDALPDALADALARHRFGLLELEAAQPWSDDPHAGPALRDAVARARAGQAAFVSLGPLPTGANTGSGVPSSSASKRT